jgi:hypothetical protein
MNMKKEGISTKISQARSAYAQGRLSKYKPLSLCGADHAKATATASWGPAMRR